MNKNLLLLSLVAPVAIAPISKAYAENAETSKEVKVKLEAKKAEQTENKSKIDVIIKKVKTARGSNKKKLQKEAKALDEKRLQLDKDVKSLEESFTKLEKDEAAAVKAEKDRLEAIENEPKTAKKLSSTDLEDAGVSIKLTSGRVQLEGSLPRACADRLLISKVNKSESVKDLNRSRIVDEKDLKAYSKVYELEVSFNSSDSYPSLADCLKTKKGLDTTSSLNSKSISYASGDLASVSFDGKVVDESESLKKIRSGLQNFNCESCNEDLASVNSTLSTSAKDDLLKSARENLLEKTLAGMDEKISKANTFEDLVELRDQLVELEKHKTKRSQSSRIAELLEVLVKKHEEIAINESKSAKSQWQRDAATSRHFSFSSETLDKASKLDLVPEHQDAFKNAAADLNTNSPVRRELLGQLNPYGKEFENAVMSSQKDQNVLMNSMWKWCAQPTVQHTFTLCGNAQQQYRANAEEFNKLQMIYAQAHPMEPSMFGSQPQMMMPGQFPQAQALSAPMMQYPQQNPAFFAMNAQGFNPNQQFPQFQTGGFQSMNPMSQQGWTF